MGTIKKLLRNLLPLPGFIVLGVLVGWLFSSVGLFLHSQAFLSSWTPLPNSVPFEEILDATTQQIVARSTAGDIYHRDSNCYIEKDCNIWNVGEVAFRHANGEYGFALERAEACPGRFWFFPQLKSHMVECLRARHLMPEHGTLVYYALMQNGEIYNWTHVSSRIAEVMLTLASCLIGALLGLITFVRRAQKTRKIT